eukprot:7452222-Alexandrium_andersonii.AAC.1
MRRRPTAGRQMREGEHCARLGQVRPLWQPRQLRKRRAASRERPAPKSPGYSTWRRPPSR